MGDGIASPEKPQPKEQAKPQLKESETPQPKEEVAKPQPKEEVAKPQPKEEVAKPQLKEAEKPQPKEEVEKPQPKEAVKPNEPAKLPELPKPSSSEKPSPGVRYESTQRGGTAAASYEQLSELQNAVPPPSRSQPGEQKRDISGAHRAEAITVTVPEPSPKEIKATTYKMPAPPVELQIIDRDAAERSVP